MVVLGLKNLWACLSWLFIYLLRCNWNNVIFISGVQHDDARVYHWIVTTISLVNLSLQSSVFFKGAALLLACGWGIPSFWGCCSGFACSCSWCLISGCVLFSDLTGCYDGKILHYLPLRVTWSLRGLWRGRADCTRGWDHSPVWGWALPYLAQKFPAVVSYLLIRPVVLTGWFCCLTFTLYQFSSNLNTSFSLVLRNPVRTRVWYIIIYFSVTG